MGRISSISMAIILLLQTYAFADVVVIVRKEAQATGNYVRICDIARVEGPAKQAEEVARTVLGPTPARGSALEISRWDIEARLYEMGIEARVVLSGNDSVRVLGDGVRPTRTYADQLPLQRLDSMPQTARYDNVFASEPLSSGRSESQPGISASQETGARGSNVIDQMQANARDRVGKAISHYLAARYQRPDVEIESQLLGSSADIPYSAHVVEVDQPMGGQVPGRASLRLKVQDTPETEPRLVTVDATTAVYALAPVAAKPLSKDEILVRGDVAIKRVRMESGKSYLPPREDALIGRKMKRTLRPGEPLLAVDTEIQAPVKQGDEVVHDTSSAGWRVTGTGKALGSGQVGDLIQVQDSATKKKFDARVTGPGTVSVIIKKKVWE